MVPDHALCGVYDLFLEEAHAPIPVEHVGDAGCSRLSDADVSGGLCFFAAFGFLAGSHQMLWFGTANQHKSPGHKPNAATPSPSA